MFGGERQPVISDHPGHRTYCLRKWIHCGQGTVPAMGEDEGRHAGLMARKLRAGLLLYRRGNQDDEISLEVLLGHMGGPFWARKDHCAWSTPKSEHEAGEDPVDGAKREFKEELGSAPPLVMYRDLGSIRQPGGKPVTVWAAEADLDAAGAVSNTFQSQWPRGSGRMRSFPEIDTASWFPVEVARVKLARGQQPLIDCPTSHARPESLSRRAGA